VRNLSVFVPVLWLARRPGFELTTIWYLSASSMVVHAAANLVLVERQIRRQEARLVP
jgi:hypothetical protein